MKRSLIAAALFLAVPALAATETWAIDSAHSSANFTVKHMMVTNVRGSFNKVTGSVMLDDKNMKNASVEATIDATTINTNEPKRDAHLKSPDFFDTAKYPTLSFKSTKVTKAGADKYKVAGDLTLHGVTKPTTLDVSLSKPVADPFAKGGSRRGVEATTTIKRSDYDLKWNKALETGGVVVGDDVKITIDAELTTGGGAEAGTAKKDTATKVEDKSTKTDAAAKPMTK